MKSFFTICAVLCLIVVQGCGSPKDANKSNFEKALLNSGLALKLCLELPGEYGGMSQYPLSIPASDNTNQDKIILHELLVVNGLETVTKDRKELPGDFLMKGRTVEYNVYNITEKGKEHLYRISSFMSKGQYLCFGDVKKISIENFTEPTNMSSHTISQIKYSYEISDLPEWVNSNASKITKYIYGRNDSASIEKQNGTAMMLLTDAGWVEGKSFKSGKKELEKL